MSSNVKLEPEDVESFQGNGRIQRAEIIERDEHQFLCVVAEFPMTDDIKKQSHKIIDENDYPPLILARMSIPTKSGLEKLKNAGCEIKPKTSKGGFKGKKEKE